MHERLSRLLAARNHLLRTDFGAFLARAFDTVNPGATFLPNWHLDLIGEYLEATRRAEITRLIVNLPPRSLKSITMSVAWPAFLLGHDPAMRILCASYAHALSLKHAMDTRLVMAEPWYGLTFPRTRMASGENEKRKFVTTERGFRFATSVGGTATGEGGDVLIVDDPLSASQAASQTKREQANLWFDQTFSTRLNDKERGRIVVVMQRLHAEDLTGHLLAKGGWEHLLLPAIAEARTVIDFGGIHKIREIGDILHPDREGAALIERARRDLGAFGFAAQYQQNPLPQVGGMVQAAWLRRYACHPERSEGSKTGPSVAVLPQDDKMRITQSWDTGIKSGAHNDASACLTAGESEGNHYVLDVLSLRAEYPELKRTILRHAENWKPHAILIEDKASGQSLLQDLRRETNLPVIPILPKQDKVTRFAAVSAMIEAGRLYLPKHAAWLAAFEQELLGFPGTPHDDQVDALTQYLSWIRAKGKGEMGIRKL